MVLCTARSSHLPAHGGRDGACNGGDRIRFWPVLVNLSPRRFSPLFCAAVNAFGPSGATTLLQAVKSSAGLAQLDLRGNNVGDGVAAAASATSIGQRVLTGSGASPRAAHPHWGVCVWWGEGSGRNESEFVGMTRARMFYTCHKSPASAMMWHPSLRCMFSFPACSGSHRCATVQRRCQRGRQLPDAPCPQCRHWQCHPCHYTHPGWHPWGCSGSSAQLIPWSLRVHLTPGCWSSVFSWCVRVCVCGTEFDRSCWLQASSCAQ